MQNKKNIDLSILDIYDQEIKEYIKTKSGMGVTLEEVQALIDSSEENTTYTLTKNENNEIVLTGSDGTTYTISDLDTKEIFSSTQPTSQKDGDVWTKLL